MDDTFYDVSSFITPEIQKSKPQESQELSIPGTSAQDQEDIGNALFDGNEYEDEEVESQEDLQSEFDEEEGAEAPEEVEISSSNEAETVDKNQFKELLQFSDYVSNTVRNQSAETELVPTSGRKRGRPKGSLNKKNPTLVAPTPVSSSSSTTSSTSQTAQHIKQWQEPIITPENRNAKQARKTREKKKLLEEAHLKQIQELQDELDAKNLTIQERDKLIEKLQLEIRAQSEFCTRASAMLGSHMCQVLNAFRNTPDLIRNIELNPGLLNYDQNLVLKAKAEFNLGMLMEQGKLIFDAVPVPVVATTQAENSIIEPSNDTNSVLVPGENENDYDDDIEDLFSN